MSISPISTQYQGVLLDSITFMLFNNTVHGYSNKDKNNAGITINGSGQDCHQGTTLQPKN